MNIIFNLVSEQLKSTSLHVIVKVLETNRFHLCICAHAVVGCYRIIPRCWWWLLPAKAPGKARTLPRPDGVSAQGSRRAEVRSRHTLCPVREGRTRSKLVLKTDTQADLFQTLQENHVTLHHLNIMLQNVDFIDYC